jgi:hypothetical protein
MATQDLADVQEPGPRLTAASFAVGIVDHREPFHSFVGVPVMTQNRRDAHQTPSTIVRLGST